MTSGEYITWFVILFFPVFIAWEVIQLIRRRAGNKSAYTMSQFITRVAQGESVVVPKIIKSKTFWAWFAVVFPLFLILVGVWLVFHWEGLCYTLGIESVCELSESV